jgi:general secretion pathway protein D
MVCRSVLSAVVLALVVLGSAPTAGAVITLTAGSAATSVNGVVSIPISVSDVTNLTAFQFDLAFDPSLLMALAVNEGADFVNAATAGGGATLFTPGVIDNTAGLITLVADAMVGVLGPGLAPSGVLATIDFQALMPGAPPLTLSNAFLTENDQVVSSANQDFGIQNGQVTVGGGVPVPEPSAVALVAVGLAVLAVRHWARRRTAPRPSS